MEATTDDRALLRRLTRARRNGGVPAVRKVMSEALMPEADDDSDSTPYMERDLRRAAAGLTRKWERLLADAEGKDPEALAAAALDDLKALRDRLPAYGDVVGVNMPGVGEEVERRGVTLYRADGLALNGRDVPHPPPRKPDCPRRCRAVTARKWRCRMPTMKGRAFCAHHAALNRELDLPPAP